MKINPADPVINPGNLTLIICSPINQEPPLHISEAEQNRLIIENMEMVPKVAAKFRGRKGIPFDELCAEGRVGLVLAARKWEGRAGFPTYATHKITSAILDFIDNWQEFGELAAPKDRDVNEFFEWEVWPYASPLENWTSLSATPEELVTAFQAINRKQQALSNAIQFLGRRERMMIEARFFRDPPQAFASIAREHRLSYARTVFIIDRGLKKLREMVNNASREAAIPSAMRG